MTRPETKRFSISHSTSVPAGHPRVNARRCRWGQTCPARSALLRPQCLQDIYVTLGRRHQRGGATAPIAAPPPSPAARLAADVRRNPTPAAESEATDTDPDADRRDEQALTEHARDQVAR